MFFTAIIHDTKFCCKYFRSNKSNTFQSKSLLIQPFVSMCSTCRALSDLLYRSTKDLAFWFPGGRHEHYGPDFDGWPQNTWLLPLRVKVDGQKNAEWDVFFWRISFWSLRAPPTHSFFSDRDGLPPIFFPSASWSTFFVICRICSRVFCKQHVDLHL